MHALTKLTICNFRSCRATELLLHDFTPIVGYNNAGKSNILNAIEWLLAASSLTHSPSLITRDAAPKAVIVRKNGNPVSTQARNPLAAAAAVAMSDASHQARMIFELGRAAEIFFSDKVLLAEGKTESRLIPLAYESLRGRSLRADRMGLVSVDSSGSLVAAKNILHQMQIEVRVVADLDFAFKVAPRQQLISPDDAGLTAARPILARLASMTNADFLPEKTPDEIRSDLPAITALLDWFSPATP